ncbi:MAG: hypothetical protein CMQ29_02950 [Gammaproteobacteria bacterium]|nr:hypothetical protein [Gammaproteobacteria bacterium]|tara:strand:- start:1796 stop:2737 length:942 start_codon:yes stop_codon:yes gene_type:complete
MKVAVIGCGGYVGSYVTAELLARGHEVRGTVRNLAPERTGWILEKAAAVGRDRFELVHADVFDKDSVVQAMRGSAGAIVCAGSPKIEPKTIPLMAAVAENCCDAALETGVTAAVFTSSTGSTNPPGGEPEFKKEMDHWSDDELQMRTGKYAAVGKTRLDRTVLAKASGSDGALRGVTINPSTVTGPCMSPEPANSLRSFAAIVHGERMTTVPNSSMSMIDVRDLAAIHVAALEHESASGRYFGVKQSWHWRDILAELARQVPGYEMPEMDPDETPVRPTGFDLTRQQSLGVSVRALAEILGAAATEMRVRNMI